LGGDSVQVMKTKEYLEKKYNVKCDIITNPFDIDSRYDIVHVFNYSQYKDTQLFFSETKKHNIPIVSSSIYWDYQYASIGIIYKWLNYKLTLNERNAKICILLTRFLASIISKPVGISSKLRKKIKHFIEESDIVSPNSIEEGMLACRYAGVNYNEIKSKIGVVVNATDEQQTYPLVDICKKYNLPNNFVLQVGRVEFVKNQMNLLLALKDNPEIPVVIVGRHVDEKYSKRLKAIVEGRGNVFFIESVPHEEIYSFYHHAKVHVLMSLRESPGLVSLEALQSGCRIVISDERFLPLHTYFDDITSYCSPLDINQIRTCVLDEYNERTPKYQLKSNFTWDKAAEQTYDIYSKLF
jgi:glycosyltransferase involved in cell wall biosynthesis